MVAASGRRISQDYYREIVAPILAREAGGIPHAAGRLGSGSDVLGYDDEQSQDHDFGLRLTLLVEDGRAPEVQDLLDVHLPRCWRGSPTRFATTWDPSVRSRCEVMSARDLAVSRTGIDPTASMTATDWCSLTGQSVLEVVAGPVFHDGTGAITQIRRTLEWYPHDVWMYALASGWSRLAQEMPDVGRAGLRGAEDGSAVIAARHVRTLMHLAHLIHRRWAPYGKWLGRSTGLLPGGGELRVALSRVLRADDWTERQDALAAAVEILAVQQGAEGLVTLRPATEPFFDRPHVGVRDLPQLLTAEISDQEVLALRPGAGIAEQISDNVSVLVDPAARRRLIG